MACLSDYGLGPREQAVLARRSVRTVYIIGDVDTGKTTLASLIVKALATKFSTALVDLDAGQANVGLPTTFGWRMAGKRKPGGLYFTGTTSPVGHMGLSVAGAAALLAEAREHAEKVVVDTCGLALGALGRQLHHATVEAMRPDVVIAIERRGELAGLLEAFSAAGRPKVIRASVPLRARKRSRATRRSYRCAKLRAYFSGARNVKLRLDEVEVLWPRPDPVGRIASLRDENGRDVALGIIQKCGTPEGTVTVLTSLPAGRKVRAIVLGSMRIARDGRQLAREV